jgi:hypothetical protein
MPFEFRKVTLQQNILIFEDCVFTRCWGDWAKGSECYRLALNLINGHLGQYDRFGIQVGRLSCIRIGK